MTRSILQRKDSRKYALWVIIVLILFGILSIAARLLLPSQFKVSSGDTVWGITITADIPPASKNNIIQISPPWDTRYIRIVAQNFNHSGMRFVRGRADAQQKRDIELKVISEDSTTLTAEFTAHLRTTPKQNIKEPVLPLTLTLDQRTEYLGSNDNIDVESPIVINTLYSISENTDDKSRLIEEIFTYVNTKIIKDTTATENDPANVLKSGHATTLGRARTMVALSRAAGIPARVVTGFILEETIEVAPYYWVEIFQDTGWVPYGPEKGYTKSLPNNFLPFNKGGGNIVTSEKTVPISYDVEQRFDLEGLNISEQKRVRDIFDLERFRPGVRNTLAIMMLLPFGALITTIIITFLGVRCYGTFTPTLIALAAVYADWVIAVVLLTIVIAIGLTGRTIIPGKIVRVSRLSIVFTIVAMSMAMGVSLMDYFDYSQGAHVVLLPIVILTTLIDRFYSAVDENGIKLAIRRLIWTMIIAALCYFVLRIDELGQFLLAFPEIHFFTLAVILMISFYKGRKISDIPSFYWLKEPAKKTKKATVAHTENVS